MKRDIKIIFLDQDGTLLSSEKEISPANYAAPESAATKGILIVPCTERFFGSIPEQIRALPFLLYFLTLNGAEVYDAKENRSLHSALISLPKVNEIFPY